MKDRRARALVAVVDALIMAGIAYGATGVSVDAILSYPVLWGAVLAAVICAVAVATSGAAILAWAAVGFILFGGLLTADVPSWPMVALALALVPLVPRPRGSLAAGVAVAAVVALGTPILLRYL